MNTQKPMHGTSKACGCSHARLGNFCKLFPKLKTWAQQCDIEEQCEAEQVAATLGGVGGIMHDIHSNSDDGDIPAGYTFFAQFVDHDITLDISSDLHGKALSNKDIAEHPNLRSASLDLDCVYGFGPEASPYLYDQQQPGRLLVGNQVNVNDVPRNSDGRALIGDPRNDENIFVSQLQLLFLRFHNRRMVGRSFEQAQTDVRFHYQTLVLHDFLHRVCDEKVYHHALGHLDDYNIKSLLDACGRVCMPVEFSVAAYRFGHTLVRSHYPANAEYPVIELFDDRFGTEGFAAVPEALTVDWRFLLEVDDCHDYVKSKAVDHLLADELIRMPSPIVGRLASDNDRSLAFRNLLRGYVLGLPSGQDVAKALKDAGYPIPAQGPVLSKLDNWQCVDSHWQKKLEKHTPLFLYLMAEAGQIGKGKRLGPVASVILLQVFITMLKSCHSILNKPEEYSDWQVDPCIAKGEHLTLADIVRYINN